MRTPTGCHSNSIGPKRFVAGAQFGEPAQSWHLSGCVHELEQIDANRTLAINFSRLTSSEPCKWTLGKCSPAGRLCISLQMQVIVFAAHVPVGLYPFTTLTSNRARTATDRNQPSGIGTRQVPAARIEMSLSSGRNNVEEKRCGRQATRQVHVGVVARQ